MDRTTGSRGTIRSARPEDLPVLQEIERAAGAPFHDLGMSGVADDEPPSLAALSVFQRHGRAWVATDEADRPVAYLLADVVDGNAHVEQVSVHPRHARQGLGRALLDAVAAWAARSGLPATTLRPSPTSRGTRRTTSAWGSGSWPSRSLPTRCVASAGTRRPAASPPGPV